MVRIGIAGLGDHIGIAAMHIDGYLRQKDKCVITALYDIIPGQGEKYKERFNLSEAEVCSSYEELLSKCDALSICTPNVAHVPLIVEALKAGKHVLCEKPFSTDSASCEDALIYERLSHRVCMIGLCYRGIPAFRYIRKLLGEGELGKIYYVRESQGGNRIADLNVKREWRMTEALSGPGAVADFGSHMLDMTDWILRPLCGPITQVQCMEGTFVTERASEMGAGLEKVDNDDVAVFNARLESGTLVSFSASRIGCDHTFEVYGEKGYLAYLGNHFQVVMHKYGEKRKELEVPKELYYDEAMPETQFFENFFFEVKEFLASIIDGAPVTTTFSRGYYIQRLIDALQLSADTDTVIDIDFEE